MNYRERVLEAYIESLKALGASEMTIQAALVAFETGYAAGSLHDKNEGIQEEMIDLLSQSFEYNVH